MDITQKINQIVDVFGMKADVAAKAMKITTGVYRKNKSEKVLTHKFNSKNLENLIDYIKKEAGKL
jgi:hypothetical protein